MWSHIESTMADVGDGVIPAEELLLGVVAAMKAELLAGEYIQADETTVPVQSNRKRYAKPLWQAE